jgi:hypothetical protein
LSELENQIAFELEKLGINLKRHVRVGNWEADFIIETPSKGTIAIEVKNRKVGIPDILSVASISTNLSHPVTSFSGSIATPTVPSKPVWRVAAENNIAIVPFSDPEDFRLRFSFINIVAEIETIGRELSSLKRGERILFKSIMENLHKEQIIDETVYNESMHTWEIRNKMMHGQDISKSELHDAVKRADAILDTLRSLARLQLKKRGRGWLHFRFGKS